MKYDNLYVGMVLRDNDPRYEGRTVTVTHKGNNASNDGGVFYHTGKREQFIKAERIYDDGKPRHQGWSLVVFGTTPQPGDKMVDGEVVGRIA